jgi:TonB-dependent starch-binding outer membrane protein SusC
MEVHKEKRMALYPGPEDMRIRKLLKHITQMVFMLLLAMGPDQNVKAQNEELISIRGVVVDAETNQPIENVNILVQGTKSGTTSNMDGEFTIEDIPAGQYTIIFSHINYILYSYTQNFYADFQEIISVRLTGRPILIDEVGIVDSLPLPFSTGYRFSNEQIRATQAYTFGQLIQRIVPRARVAEYQGNLYIQLQLRQTIYQRHERMRDPYPLIIIDGMKLGTSPIGLAGVAPPSQIQNLTVIRPPESQTIYGPEATHGVIIIETIKTSDEPSLLTTRQLNMIIGGLVAFMISMILIF